MTTQTLHPPSSTPMRYRVLFSLLEKARYGSLQLQFPDGNRVLFTGAEEGPQAEITLYDWSVIDRSVMEGDIGFGETYMERLWDTPDLPAVLNYFTQNVEALERLFHGNGFYRVLFGLGKMFTPNTRKGSKRNIYAHYDLGNDFYKLWLDESMTYSSGLFATGADSLPEAQKAKYGRLLEQMHFRGDGHLLEVGCGWGGFMQEAAQQDWRVTGLTISPAQAEFANARMVSHGLAGKGRVSLCDYRDVEGKFDNIVSIEMFEAVGRRYWKAYFESLARVLKEQGHALIQTITIADEVFPHYHKRGDFIQRHIFPGGMLPSDASFRQAAAAAGLSVKEAFAFGQDYHRTLGEWLKRFDAVLPQVRAMGFDEFFIRKWRFYLAYCMAGFASTRTNVVQYCLMHNAEAGA